METFSKKETLNLIEGKFNTTDAAEVLFSILGAKINFHNTQILSIKERFNGDTHFSEKRLKELLQAKQKVSELIAEARANNYDIDIKSTVEVSLKES